MATVLTGAAPLAQNPPPGRQDVSPPTPFRTESSYNSRVRRSPRLGVGDYVVEIRHVAAQTERRVQTAVRVTR